MERKRSAVRRLRALMFVGIVLAAASSSLYAGGAKEIDTEIQLSRPPAYISPGNPATGHDSLTIDNIKLKIDPKGAIKSYTLNIYNKNGEIIFTKAESKLEGRGFFGDLLNIGDVPQVKIPATFNWPGVDTAGKIVADGEYFYQLTVLDSFSKKSSTPPLSVVVDTKAPQILGLTNNHRIFSPNGDQVRDTIIFIHKTDAAYKWTESILDEANNVIWTKETLAPGDTAPSDIVFATDTTWDGMAGVTAGTATAGAIVPEGNYIYRFAGADRAGNSVSKDLPFIVSFSASDVSLAIDGDNPYFNPIKGIKFKPQVDDTKGLSGWTLEIQDADKIVFRRFAGVGLWSSLLPFNGKGNPGRPEGEGNLLADGQYFAVFNTAYDSGAQSATEPLPIFLDSTAPYAQVVLDSSPQATERNTALVIGGENKNQLKIVLRYEAALVWNVRLQRLDPNTLTPATGANEALIEMPLAMLLATMQQISSEPASDQTISTLLWKGDMPPSADPKQLTSLPDGTWQLNVLAQDKAGNDGISPPVRFIFDRTGTGIHTTTTVVPDVIIPTGTGPFRGAVTADPSIFSPDNDGVADTVNLVLDVNGTVAAVSSWKLEILDPIQHSFRTWSGTGMPPANINWDGKSETGEIVQSAMDYTALFTIVDDKGATNRSMTTVSTDILVVKEGNRLRIALPNIEFPGNSADLFENARAVLDKNLDTLRRLARILNRYADYHISIEGHATHVLNDSKADQDREQINELLPLSSRRALEVKQALNILAVGWDRMATLGLGGSQPVVPHTDLENRWKNRRVEFILDRK